MKIYIDIDGVILTRDHRIPDYAEDLIYYLVANHNCYWLTTHCRGGENRAVNYLAQFYKGEILEKLMLILPTDWLDLKTEAIDFESEFVWLDDYVFVSEKEVLQTLKKSESLIEVDLNRNDELKTIHKRIIQLSYNTNGK